jgi:hypothetical protein
VFTKNRDRLLEGDVAAKSMAAVLGKIIAKDQPRRSNTPPPLKKWDAAALGTPLSRAYGIEHQAIRRD